MLMMLAALGKIGGGRLWSKRQAADAHEAGGFGENWGDCGVNARQLMLICWRLWGKLMATVE